MIRVRVGEGGVMFNESNIEWVSDGCQMDARWVLGVMFNESNLECHSTQHFL